MSKANAALLFAGILVVSIISSAGAQEIGFGGIEVGVTACDEAVARAQQNGDVTETFISAITDAPGVKLRSNAFGFNFVQGGIMLCGPDQKVAGIFLTIPKHRAGEIADALAAKYQQRSRNLPQLGAGSARYESSSKKTTAEVSYVHVSFEAEVAIETKDFTRMMSAYQNKKKEEEKAKTKSAF